MSDTRFMRGHSASGTGGNVAVMTTSPAAVADSSATPPHPPQAADTVSGRAGTIAVVVVLVAAFMDLLDATIVSVAAPAIQTGLHASGSALQWMVAGYTLALGGGLITGGRIGDQYGRRKIFLIGLTGFILASTLCALSGSAGVLIAMRVLQGLAGGLMVPQVFGIIRSSFAPAARAKAFGAYGAVLGLASIAGPLLGGLLVDVNLFGLGWRTIFWVNVPIGVIGLALGAKFLPTSPPESASHRTGLDLIGAALASLTAVLVLLPLVQGRDQGWPWWGFVLLGASPITAALFLGREERLACRGGEPILNPALLRNRAFASGLASSLLFFGAIGPFFLCLSLYLQLGTGRSAWQTGLVMLPYAVGSILTSGIGVALAAKAGRALLITGSLVLAASQLMLWQVVRDGAQPSYWLLALPLFIGGLGLGLAAPILINVILAGIPGRDAGAAGGVLTTVNQIGGAAGVAVLVTLFFSALGQPRAHGASRLEGFSHALATILPWQVGLYIVAALLMLLLPKKAADHQQ